MEFPADLSSPPGSRTGSSGTLAREGIMSTVFTGTGRVGRAVTLRDQDKIEIPSLERRKLNVSPIPLRGLTNKAAKSVLIPTAPSSSSSDYLPRSQWLSLGDGWFQATAPSSGSSSRCGLHSVIESSPGQVFICVYEPRTMAATTCLAEHPEYDLEVHMKIFSTQLSTQALKSQIIFAFKSPSNYLALVADAKRQHWVLRHTNEAETTNICEIFDPTLRVGVFFSILIQIRSGLVSVDINGVPTFTSIKPPECSNMNGLVGVLSTGSKFAIKHWKLRGGGMNNGNDDKCNTRSQQLLYSSQQPGLVQPPKSPQLKGPRSLSQLISVTSMSALSANLSAQRLGDPAVPIGGGGPGRPKAVKSQDGCSSETDTDVLNPENTGFGIDERENMCAASDLKLSTCVAVLAGRHEKNIVDTVMRDVIQRDLGVSFDDIAALADAKRLLNEAIVLPLLMPEFFIGIREPWKGVLLFGPPGTGKTLLAKAVAGINSSTFFSCSASSLISKFRGDSEKLVRCLFEAARLCAPSIVFLDEVDALVSARGGEGEHEASRRLKTELFAQMDGVNSSTGASKIADNVMVLCTTNCPWDLDEAMRRRLEKRIYIPLPDFMGRLDMFTICLKDIPVGEVNLATLAELTEGYSGADVHLVCREASMIPMRKLLARNSPAEIKTKRLEIPKVEFEDFELAIASTRPSVAAAGIERFEVWSRDFGST